MSRRVGVAVAAVVGILISGSVAGAVSAGSTHFPRYKELEPNVAFWRDSFTKWTSKQIVFHDVEHLDLVYSVLSIDDIVRALPQKQQEDAIRARRKAEGERLEAMLQRIGSGQSRTEEEHRIVRSIARIGHEPEYATTLATQIRSQRGLGDKFCGAMQRAYTYLPMMKEILRSQQVPEELVALPLVESGYQIGADSSVGAAGIWQFMPGTGRLYLDVNDSFDDRRDPLRATEAAARMLRKSYDTLGSWPLAITSYNHGLGGVANAVKTMGTTHFGVIARHYKGKTFGFASRNFYAEFLAASDSVQHADEICGPIQVEPYRPDEFTLEASASIRDLAKAAGISVDELETINPALRDSVVRGSKRVPAGYRLNLPNGARGSFAVAYARTPRGGAGVVVAQASTGADSASGALAASAGPRSHRVVRGQSLTQIASRYGTSVATLQKMNGLGRSKTVRTGQVLKVPAAAGSSKTAPTVLASAAALKAAVKAAAEVDTAQAGAGGAGSANQSAAVQAAEAAAEAAKTAVASVPAAAVVTAAATGRKGESDGMLTTTHKVGRGQTLSQIAAMYKTSSDELKVLNGISDSRDLRYGQTIKVRASGTAIASAAPVGAAYKVRSGDTLWSIAQANGTSVETLTRMNPGLTRGLKAGASVKVPARGSTTVAAAAAARASTKLSFASHRVERGQSLSSIAEKYGTSVDEIKRINGIRDSRKVQAGQTLRVPL